MPKKISKDKHARSNKLINGDDGGFNNKSNKKFNCDESSISVIDIGGINVKRWKALKNKCSYDTDIEFVKFLLNILEERLKKSCTNGKRDSENFSRSPKTSSFSSNQIDKSLKKIHLKSHHHIKNGKNSHQNNIKNFRKKPNEFPTVKKQVINDTIPTIDLNHKRKEIEISENNNINNEEPPSNKQSVSNTKSEENDLRESNILENEIKCAKQNYQNHIEKSSQSNDDITKTSSNDSEIEKLETNNLEVKEVKNGKHKRLEDSDEKHAKKKLKSNDIRKAPQLNDLSIIPLSNDSGKSERDVNEDNVKIKIKLCHSCDSQHVQDVCPLQNPIVFMSDKLTLSDWEKIKTDNNSSDLSDYNGSGDSKHISYAEASLPYDFYLEEVDEKHGLSVFVNLNLNKYTRLGPLIGPVIKEVDIPDDFNMKHIWELKYDDIQVYINTENINSSNWVRFVRPAETREKRNASVIIRDGKLYLVTVRDVKKKDELRYWIDDYSNTTGKRRFEKTNCGGCNLTFDHTLYYRTHCSVFHDIRYSLTIRKYHCKVCGQAILGKDNIVRHAAELHNGRGAYQCQFCKKFFLRLNYLDMHRTYGCAANPHRSRPLCDFCGRKFCQPQKLKVHIKRMHSDISLSEFQCPLCSKLLGSRAAVQRHAREVHRTSVSSGSISPAQKCPNFANSSLSCGRCGKLFQNKSNLKIHMLTHSGVKPFKCKQENCNAAFTTKQCLQFHYKKVHGFTEDVMPTIERSVEYTFEAYSGGIKPEKIKNDDSNAQDLSSPKLIDVSDSTSIDKDENKYEECSSVIRVTSPITSAEINVSPTLSPIECEKPSFLSSTPLLSKGSKKWLGNLSSNNQNIQNELYNFEDDPQQTTDDGSSIILEVDESQNENNSANKFSMCLNVYNPRQEGSNASLLVEAALDSVSDIQINSESNQNCSDSLVVSNLYPLSQQDGYIPGELTTDRGDVSVTDYDIQHEEFSPPNSPTLPNHLIHEYVVRHDDTHSRTDYHNVERSPNTNHSPPRYDFNQTLNTDNLSNDSDGIVAQNLSINAKDKDRLDQQLDFSSYKTHYSDVDSTDLSIRKYDTRISKFDLQADERDSYNMSIDVTDGRKSYEGNISDVRNELNNDQYSDVMDTGLKCSDVDLIRNKAYDCLDSEALRALKYDEIELRNKSYDILEADDLRNKSIFDNSVENELRANKVYNLIESDFRTDRSFEHLILNPTELQGLDMSARGYHGFHGGTAVSRYHHMYGEPDRETSVPGYGPPTDVLRVVSLDLTSQGRHGSLHGLHSHHSLLTDHSRLTLDQTRLISSDHNLSVALLGTESRLLSDHTTSRILSNDQLTEARLVPSPETHRMLSESAARLPSRTFSTYPMSPAAYHPSSLTSRSHIGSPPHNPPTFHHYSGYY